MDREPRDFAWPIIALLVESIHRAEDCPAKALPDAGLHHPPSVQQLMRFHLLPLHLQFPAQPAHARLMELIRFQNPDQTRESIYRSAIQSCCRVQVWLAALAWPPRAPEYPNHPPDVEETLRK